MLRSSIMLDWNSEQYLKFKAQRTKPAHDLAVSVIHINPKKVVDIGCGPGNSTEVLRKIFPDADIIGIDNSPNMIEKAKDKYPDMKFRLCDAERLDSGYDLVYSNACLQWIPDHRSLLPDLFGKLNNGGVLAVQIPINGNEPLYRIIAETVAEERWSFPVSLNETNRTLTTNEYFDILSSLTDCFDIWETVYYHEMPSCESLLEWVKGTRLRPYLDHLGEERGKEFEGVLLERAKQVYPIAQNGSIIFRFRRLFFTAQKIK